jgi:iron complex outermembrane receptor protein
MGFQSENRKGFEKNGLTALRGGQHKMSSKLLSALLLSSALATVGNVPAYSQESRSTYGLEEITVTARKRDENLQNVPDSIIALSGDFIEKTNIRAMRDVTAKLPNVSIVESLNPGSTFVNIRGVTATRNGEPAVSLMIDGVQINNVNQMSQSFYDLQQIEILKGPQGALYGRNAIGGAIIITTRKPSNEFENRIEAGYGSGDNIEFQGSSSGAIIKDKLFYRISANYRDFDGTFKNTAVDEKADFVTNKDVRARLIYMASERFEIDFRFSYDDLRAGTYWYRADFEPLQHNNFDRFPESDPISAANREIEDYVLKMTYDADWATINSISAYSKTYEEYGITGDNVGSNLPGDLDWTPFPILANEQTYDVEAFSQEFRFTSPSDQRFRWVAGVYALFTERTDTLPFFVAPNNFGQILTNFANGVDPLFNLDPDEELLLQPSADNDQDNEAYAAFAQINYDVTEDLELTVALRYDREERKQIDNNTLIERERKFNAFQPKASLSYQATDDAMVYGTVSRGYRVGGFNATTSTFGRDYDSESLWNYELGFKTTWLDNRLRINGAAFYQDFTDTQIFQFDGSASAQILYNIPKTELMGLELEIDYVVAEGLTLNIGAGLLDSKIKDFDPVEIGFTGAALAAVADAEGNKLNNFHHWSYNIGAQYETPINANGAMVIFRVDYSAKGDRYWWIDNVHKEKDLHLVDGSITVDTGNIWEFQLWAKNLFDMQYASAFEPVEMTALLSDGQYRASGRTYGFKARARF